MGEGFLLLYFIVCYLCINYDSDHGCTLTILSLLARLQGEA